MPSIDATLAAELAAVLGLSRAVETGTHLGAGARRLAASFGQVITIELSPELAERARANLRDLAGRVRVVQGNSVDVLATLRESSPTLWFLDGHWSGGPTAGHGQECPVIAELDVVSGGHPDDVVVIDDARLFAAAPPPPHDPAQWPSLIEVLDRLRAGWPGHHVTVIDDQVLAVPARARATLDRHAHRLAESSDNGSGGRHVLRRLWGLLAHVSRG